MIQRSLTFILTITLAGSLQAQEQKSVLQLAEEAYAREEYAVAGALYQRIARNKKDRTPLPLMMKMAHSHRETGRFSEAASFYRQIIARPNHPAAAYFAYGEVLRQLEQYDSARQQYALFNTNNTDSVQLKNIALQGCDSAALWKQTPAPLQLQPLKELNTPGSDLVNGRVSRGLLLMSNGYRNLVLSGLSEANPSTDKRTQQPFYKAYTYRQNTQGNPVMHLEELLPGVMGKFDYHIGPACLSNAEDTLYATINIQGKSVPLTSRKGAVNGKRQLQIWQSVKTDGRWSQPVLLPGINMAGYSSSHALLNREGNVLYFVSDRPGGQGQSDLWYCEKQADGTWGTPVNCGSINTIAAESFPTMNEEGVLYFSSKGLPGFGGYDIFRAKGEKASWQTPENIKAPLNSGADDIGFIADNNGRQGYIASNKQGGAGSDDIYYFTDVDFFNRLNGIQPPAVNTGHNIHPPATQNPNTSTSQPNIAKQHGAEEEADKQTLEQLKFLYDYNSARLLPESQAILDQVASVMQQHPEWKIMIISYADSRGSDAYNNNLSAKRCLSAINYLAGKGISEKRLYYVNKGELDPVNRCADGVPCSEEEYRPNRRSELRVMW